MKKHEAEKINRRGDPLVCMVVGCGKAALYRNASPSCVRSGVKRGHCREHKALAVTKHVYKDRDWERERDLP